MGRVAIIGVAQIKYQRNSPSSHDEMVFEVVQQANTNNKESAIAAIPII